ncbi:MAG: hypothetical protein AB1635_00870 [Acidobacteriota bacterium]
MTIVSRGGPASWYQGIGARYADVLDVVGLDAFRSGNAARRDALGEQKQVRSTNFDESILDSLRERLGCADAGVLHPSLMYRLFAPYWWRHAGVDWVARHSRFEAVPPPPLPQGFPYAPGHYIAVKFYTNDCFFSAPETRQGTARLTAALSRRLPVVSLATAQSMDDHAGADGVAVLSVLARAEARSNLEVQTAILGNARAFVGTYGGFSYLAPFFDVPALGVYTSGTGFDQSHLTMARHACTLLGGRTYGAVSLDAVDPDRVAEALA